MNISGWYLFQGVCNVIIFQRIVGPQFFGTTTNEAAIARAMPQARAVIAELSRLLGEQPFMVGDHLSLADLQAAPQASVPSLTPEWTELTAGHSNLVAWIDRLEGRPSFKSTTMAELMARAQAA
ncbi:glutathione S-transferase family protein [Bradyrhizobium sp. SZCCHNRI3043]|uniref:glutathione S-transferase family protein n=1 Tax=Bradyrhizobium sp. SZCCHNRI3043 TaxID=3057292 RepID=UPI0028EB2F37|nr:glutathione S-transferase family protein [Bradyrhizobium sp. SZCCHNRI3043]